MKNLKDRYQTQIQMNITSMIDVVFMLLIIFIIAAPLMRAEVDVKLPKSAAARIKDQTAITIAITADGELFIGKTPIPIEDLPAKLEEMAAAGQVTSVSLKGDESINYGLIMRVVGYIKEAGIENLGLVATPEKKRGGP